MSALTENSTKAPIPTPTTTASLGRRVNGKNWHISRAAFRPKSGRSSYADRLESRKALATTKARVKEMKEEKEAERRSRITKIKDRRAVKEEKERYEKMAEKMHWKRVERLRRREKRNKLLKS